MKFVMRFTFWAVLAVSSPAFAQAPDTADPAKAKAAQSKAGCAQKVAVNCVDYGTALLQRDTVTIYTQMDAANFFRKGCDYGSGSGCRRFGQMVQAGRGTPLDPARAIKLFEQACAARDGEGCHLAGKAYTQGNGAPIDTKRAIAFFKTGCAFDFSASCLAIGLPLPGTKLPLGVSPVAPTKVMGIPPLRNAQIDAAVSTYSSKIAQQGYRPVFQSELSELSRSVPIDLVPAFDYVAFAACSEGCGKINLTVITPTAAFRLPTNKDEAVPTKFVILQSPSAGSYAISINPNPACSQRPCYGRLAVYRRDHVTDSAGRP